MLDTFEEAYTETRRMLAGAIEPKPPYAALIEWIAQQSGGANVVNVVYTMWARSRPCLTVVMEREADVAAFAGDSLGSREIHQRIISRFREILSEQRNTKIVTDNIFVIVSSFAPTTRAEANESVPPDAIFALVRELAEPTIWIIQPRFDYLRVFLHTDEQLVAAEKSDLRNRIVDRYRRFIEPYDQFGYVKEEPIQPVFASRERFENVYLGSWQGYDRDNP
jgi:hypothetical protein